MLENKSSHYEGLGILENYEKKTEKIERFNEVGKKNWRNFKN